MGIRILLVEDNPDFAGVLKTILETLGYDVAVATDGKEAVRMAVDQVPDLMILDIMLPEMDGIEVATHIRRDPKVGSLPILAITANFDFRIKLKSLAAGCNAFLNKPFTNKQLNAAVEKLLKKAGEAKGLASPRLGK